jgi:hypothetical protein
MEDFIQINRINPQALPGPGFSPGVTYDGGGLVAPVGGWTTPEEERFPADPEPRSERPDFNYHPMEVNYAGNMWNFTRERGPVPLKSRWPRRRMQFDKGITVIEAPGQTGPSMFRSDNIIIFAALVAAIAYATIKRS